MSSIASRVHARRNPLDILASAAEFVEEEEKKKIKGQEKSRALDAETNTMWGCVCS